MKSKKLVLIGLFFVFLFPAVAFALNFQTGDNIFNTETINDDYYAAGKTIQMESNVNGDLMLAGGQINVNSKVSQDLTLAGGEINVKGEVDDDARIGGGNITINAIVKDDLIVGGGNIELGGNGYVGGDFIFGGGNIIINGPVNGDARGAGGSVYINNTISGNVDIYNADSVRFGPLGKVLGNFTYKSPEESLTVNTNTVSGIIEYKPSKIPVTDKDMRSFLTALVAGFSIFRFLTILFAGLFFVWIFRHYMVNTVKTCYKNNLKSFGVGLLVLIVTPIAAIISLMTGVGIFFSFILMLFWILLLTLAKIIAVSIVGMKIIPVTEKHGFLRAYGSYVIGALVFVLITIVPFIGWIIKFIFTMMGVGAILLYSVKMFHSMKKEKKA